MVRYALRRLALALLTLAALVIAVGFLVPWLGNGCMGDNCAGSPAALTPGAWLGAAFRLDFGRAADNQPVTTAIVTALPASLLLIIPVVLIDVLCGWGGGALSVLRRSGAARRLGLAGRLALALATVCQIVPIFWLGG